MDFTVLNRINSARDVKTLPAEQIPVLAKELRSFLIENVTKTGGHLASNLGVVELTIALHRVFDTPHDRIFFDVGHQCYVHKILTGRKDLFDTLRQNGGLSGFAKPEESEHDPFVTGHASTSLSLALGFAEADRMKHEKHYNIAVIGDGAYTGGMIHEALNNVQPKDRLILILNENEMSISPNTGAFAKHLANMRSTESYFRFKRVIKGTLQSIPYFGPKLRRRVTSVKRNVKNLIYKSNYFENLGFLYLGPIDGNDYEKVERLLQEAKRSGDNVVIHLKTKKGLGFAPAEENPGKFHGIAPMEYYHRDSKETIPPATSFSAEFGSFLAGQMKTREDIAVITAAMTEGTGLTDIREQYGDRFFDVGIAEAHAATFSAALGANGIHPVFAVYSTFLQRSYDSLIHDIGIRSLPVTIAIDRAGYNDADGVTHNGIFDVSFLSGVHGFSLWSPADYASMRADFQTALEADTPSAVRYPKGTEIKNLSEKFDGKPGDDLLTFLPDNCDTVIVTYGTPVSEAMSAAAKLADEGIVCGIILMNRILPYSVSGVSLQNAIPDGVRFVCFAEEGIRCGGASMNWYTDLSEWFAAKQIKAKILAIDNPFTVGVRGKSMREAAGIDMETMVRTIRSMH